MLNSGDHQNEEMQMQDSRERKRAGKRGAGCRQELGKHPQAQNSAAEVQGTELPLKY